MKTTKARVLVIEDDPYIMRLLKDSLEREGCTVLAETHGLKGVETMSKDKPDIVLLDLTLPDGDGIDVVRRLREMSSLPIIIISAREDETQKILAFDLGADDYLTKPFSVVELLARVRANLRRSGAPQVGVVFSSGGLVVDVTERRVRTNHREVQLTPTEYDLLKVLTSNAGKVMTHRQLLHQVWGNGYEDGAHLLQVNISNLRRKIETDPTQPRYILSEPRVGYRLQLLPPDEN